MRRRRIGIAATTLALATVAALSPLMRSPAPDASRTAQPVVATVPVAPAPTAVDVELPAIDRPLQAGYARNATDAQLKPLLAHPHPLTSCTAPPAIARAPGREGGWKN